MTIYDHFEALDLRSGCIQKVEDFPEARKPAFKLYVDFGPEIGVLKSSAQITELYKKEDLLNKTVVGIVNLPPRQIANFMSECLVLGLYSADGVVLLCPDKEVPPGLKLG
ncbi:tRNA-binding protein [bacterium]|nr:tRNA-binding protein [bacterium]